MVKGMVISLLLCNCWILAQLLVFHFISNRRTFRTLTLLFLLSLPLYGVGYLGTPPHLGFLPDAFAQTPLLLGLLNGLGLHVLFYFTYLACFYYVERPLTWRILIPLLRTADGKMTLSELKEVYGLTYVIQRRLVGMEEGGLVIQREGKYFLTSKGERLGKFFHFARKALRIDRKDKMLQKTLRTLAQDLRLP